MSAAARKKDTSIDVEGLGYEDLVRLQQDTAARINELKEEKFNDLVAEVREKAEALDIDVAELAGALAPRPKAKTRPRAGAKVAPKYRDPADPSVTWSGRGRKPLWFAAALENGKSEDDMLIGDS